MNVEQLRHRTKSVCGIDVATVLAVVLQSPSELLGVRAVRILPVIVPELVKIVYVCALRVQYLAEHAVLRHIQSAHLEPVVAAVLENHAVELLLFSQVDELPTFLKVHCRGHLVGYVLAVLHCALCHNGMMLPVGSYIDKVDIVAAAQFLIALLAVIDGGRSQSVLAQRLVLLGCARLYVVAKSHNLNTRYQAEVFYRTRSAHAKTDEAHAHRLHLRECQSEHILLSCGAFGRLNHYLAFVPMPFCRRRERLCVCRQRTERHHSGKSHT